MNSYNRMNEMLSAHPQRLYMYFKADGAEKFLENHNLKLSDLRKCNDPFECAIDYNTSLKTTGYIDKHAYCEQFNERDIRDLQAKWWEAHKNLRISCFTEYATNILMWAYYAEGQKGICIEFDPSKDPLFFENLRKVKYRTKLATINKGCGEELDYSEILITKATQWQHEKEWRVIRDDLHSDFFPISPQAITSVIFGCASAIYYNDYGMSDTYERIFHLLQKPEYAHIQLQCISPATEIFELQHRNMPFFVFMKDQHTISIISTQKQCLQIWRHNDYKDTRIYEASVCQWEKNTITLPNGYYLISNAVDNNTVLVQIFDE